MMSRFFLISILIFFLIQLGFGAGGGSGDAGGDSGGGVGGDGSGADDTGAAGNEGSGGSGSSGGGGEFDDTNGALANSDPNPENTEALADLAAARGSSVSEALEGLFSDSIFGLGFGGLHGKDSFAADLQGLKADALAPTAQARQDARAFVAQAREEALREASDRAKAAMADLINSEDNGNIALR